MKKKNLQALRLNKKSISNLKSEKIIGAADNDVPSNSGGITCTNYSMFN